MADVDLAQVATEEGVEIMPGVRVRLRSLADYQQNPENPVGHTPHNLSTIVESVHKVGAARSGLAADDTIYAGNLTSEAMAIAGIEGIIEVTTDGTQWVMVNRPDLTPEQRKQAAHGDQWSAMLAEMDVGQLLADIEAGINLDGIYSDFDLEAILGEALEVETGEAPEAQVDKGAELAEHYGVKVGQVWTLGEHRLAVGDCTDKAVVDAVMGGEKAACMWTDPPYGVEYVGKTENALTIEGDEIESLPELLTIAFRNAEGVLIEGAPFYVAHPPGALQLIFLNTIDNLGWRIHEQLIWVKDSMVLGHSDYHYKHEPILYGWTPGDGRPGRGNHEGSRWYGDNSQVSTFEIPRPKVSREHPTMKPIELIEVQLKNSTRVGDVVYDPFVGSGTTIVACQRLGRRAYACEISPMYAAICIQRLADMGLEPKLLE